jgi:cytochrome c oxidase cbb3-type subunit III
MVLMLLGAFINAVSQNSNSEESSPSLQPDLRGKSIFELKCAACHGLDGLGGEHAPDVIRRPAVRALSDQQMFGLIHDGIPEDGMPGFSSMSKEDAHAVVAYVRFLQGNSTAGLTRGDPARGHDLFFGKGGCSGCHVISASGQFVAGDLAGFGRDHQAGEIREAILRPDGGQQETATAVARNGQKLSGTIRNEDNASLQLQDADGRLYLLMKSSLVSVQRQTGTPMPVDYATRLSVTELGDLVAYILREAGGPDLHSSPPGKDENPHAQE